MPDLHPKIEGTIIDAVLSGSHLRDKCERFYFEDEAGKRHHQAVAISNYDENVACLFSLPTDQHNIYITVSDGDRQVIRRALATLEGMEVDSLLLLGNVVLLDAPEFRWRSVVGAALLPPATSNMLEHLPLDMTICGHRYRFLLVVFLTEREHEVWKTRGHDALMDHFTDSGKDLVSFGTLGVKSSGSDA